jgi:hypothetical protein
VAELVVMDPHMVPWMQEQFPDVDGPVAALSKVYLMMRLRLRNTPTGFVWMQWPHLTALTIGTDTCGRVAC